MGLVGTIPVEWVVFFVFSSCALLAAAVGMPEPAAVVVGVTGAGLAREGSVTVICTGARSALMVVSKAAVDGWATGGGARVRWATDGWAGDGWAIDGWAIDGWALVVPERAAVVVGVTGAILARERSVTVICTGARSALMVVGKAAVDGWAPGGVAPDDWAHDGWAGDWWATDGWAIGVWAPDGWATGGWVNGGWATGGWATDGWAIDGWWFWSSRKGGAWGGGDRVAGVDAPVSGAVESVVEGGSAFPPQGSGSGGGGW